MTNKIDVDDTNFDKEVIEKSKEIPVVVDFWSSWCPPCTILTPILNELTKEYNGKFILAKVNVDFAPEKSRKYEIRSIPNVKMFQHGKIIDEFIGAIPKPMIKQWLEKNLK